MKMKRYLAVDMRNALAAVREEQGPDAVILSTRTLPQGVEVCAAVDLELAAGQGTLAETAALKQLEREALEALEREAEMAADSAAAAVGAEQSLAADVQFDDWRNASNATAGAVSADSVDADDASSWTWTLAGIDAERTSASSPYPRTLAPTASVQQELRSLRSILEQQVAALTWNDFTRREPLKARALTDLARIGVDATLALQILSDLPANLSNEQLQRMPYALLARRIQACAPPAQVRGALALIGPTGSGKTTTLAKIASRYVLEQDAANLLIISTDDERLAAHEQLRSLGRLLGVRVEVILDGAELAARIAALPGRCVLIDTPGLAGRDATALAQFRILRDQCSDLTSMLVLPASAQAGVIDDAVTLLGPPLSSCCVVTRIDEAVSLGGTLSALVRSQLPVAYCAEGPRIPEDLRPARAHQLVARAVELARVAHCSPDDELLARRYGGKLHAAA
jgi:flagellar biosynthesis protein FlhF